MAFEGAIFIALTAPLGLECRRRNVVLIKPLIALRAYIVGSFVTVTTLSDVSLLVANLQHIVVS